VTSTFTSIETGGNIPLPRAGGALKRAEASIYGDRSGVNLTSSGVRPCLIERLRAVHITWQSLASSSLTRVRVTRLQDVLGH
jgi:hypothetical protein